MTVGSLTPCKIFWYCYCTVHTTNCNISDSTHNLFYT